MPHINSTLLYISIPSDHDYTRTDMVLIRAQIFQKRFHNLFAILGFQFLKFSAELFFLLNTIYSYIDFA